MMSYPVTIMTEFWGMGYPKNHKWLFFIKDSQSGLEQVQSTTKLVTSWLLLFATVELEAFPIKCRSACPKQNVGKSQGNQTCSTNIGKFDNQNSQETMLQQPRYPRTTWFNISNPKLKIAAEVKINHAEAAESSLQLSIFRCSRLLLEYLIGS